MSSKTTFAQAIDLAGQATGVASGVAEILVDGPIEDGDRVLQVHAKEKGGSDHHRAERDEHEQSGCMRGAGMHGDRAQRPQSGKPGDGLVRQMNEAVLGMRQAKARAGLATVSSFFRGKPTSDPPIGLTGGHRVDPKAPFGAWRVAEERSILRSNRLDFLSLIEQIERKAAQTDTDLLVGRWRESAV